MDTTTTTTATIYWKKDNIVYSVETINKKDDDGKDTGVVENYILKPVNGGDPVTVSSADGYTPCDENGTVLPSSFSEGGARRRRRKTAKKMSKRQLKKWCKSKKNCRSAKGRKMCKK
jgi:hypothetical protein